MADTTNSDYCQWLSLQSILSSSALRHSVCSGEGGADNRADDPYYYNSGGLGNGARIGIGLGIAVAVLLVFCGISYMRRR